MQDVVIFRYTFGVGFDVKLKPFYLTKRNRMMFDYDVMNVLCNGMSTGSIDEFVVTPEACYMVTLPTYNIGNVYNRFFYLSRREEYRRSKRQRHIVSVPFEEPTLWDKLKTFITKFLP